MAGFDIISFLYKCTKNEPKTKDEIYGFVKAATTKEIADYQVTAFLMSIAIYGMSDQEIAWLTDAMARSGVVYELPPKEGRVVIDKHSSGGIGDKATIILAPILACAGICTFKASGRGLGFTGGTIDKLAAGGLKTDISFDEALSILEQSKIMIIAQTAEVAPADKMFYHLRDVTATVASTPLIASSIMSKKLSFKVDYLFLDVKYGTGAFCKTLEIARELAVVMHNIAKLSGMRVSTHLTSMQQPLGWGVGSAIEVLEVQEFFMGENQSPHLKEYLYKFAAQILVTTGKYSSHAEAEKMIDTWVKDGSALKAMERWFEVQGACMHTFKSKGYFKPQFSKDVVAKKSGYFGILNNEDVGHICNKLGAGRVKATDNIDFHAGIKVHKKVNDEVKEGDVLYTFYSSKEICDSLVEQMLNNTIISDKPQEVLKVFLDLE